MNPGWNDTIDRLDADLAARLERSAVPPPHPEPPPAPDFSHFLPRWEAALDRLDADGAALDAVLAELTAFRDRLPRG
ncbi:MAG: hypothetical protein ACRC33_22825 [Gemmataceae bacterium]